MLFAFLLPRIIASYFQSPVLGFNCRSTLERRSSARCKQLNLRENKKRFIVKFSAKCSEKGELHVLAGEGNENDERTRTGGKMADSLDLPVIDLSSADRISTAKSIRKACVEYGFFYLVNHGVEEELLKRVFDESRKLFSLPLEEKMKLALKEYRGYTPLYAANLEPSSNSRGFAQVGDSKETFFIGPIDGITTQINLNQWPSEGMLMGRLGKTTLTQLMYSDNRVGRRWGSCISRDMPMWSAGKRLISLIALALNLDECFFEKVGALGAPMAFLRLLHYPGELAISNEESYGASAHSDYGMVTLLATDGIRGLQAYHLKKCFYLGVNRSAGTRMSNHVSGRMCFMSTEVIQVPCFGPYLCTVDAIAVLWLTCTGMWPTIQLVRPEILELKIGSVDRSNHLDSHSFELAFIVNIGDMMERWTNCLFRFPPIRSGNYLYERFRPTYSS
ncbi:hypothetical protein HHK36_000926 [Tetracentron sinense]|uniref:Non-haem dioxygenase N-terminal domain-containing protein n=1 Tax=Tetracentron sinense TaxID=13715 RepID=A0A835DUB0_TETSI|nr:hypothetical protein HHK36_000926 [Tetracentron sinense]